MATTVVDVPVLVALNPSRIEYDEAGPNGESLDFRDSNGTPIEYEIAVWNPQGESLVWMRPTNLVPGSTILMSYGTRAGVMPNTRRNARDVWSDYGLALHFEGGVSDSSAAGQTVRLEDGANIGNGRIGGGAVLDGVDDYLTIGEQLDTFSGASAATVSAWVQTTSTGDSPLIEYADGVASTSRVFFGLIPGHVPRIGVLTTDGVGANSEVAPGEALAVNEWYWLLGTVDLVAQRIQMYVDGELVANRVLTLSAATFPPSASVLATIGRNDTSPAGFMEGTIDEVRAAPIAVSADYVRAQYLSMTDALFSFGPRIDQ